ncbi:lipoyl synthase [bacterium F11]|nr:lipoyl synthase [bacterium F11]
MNTKIKIDAPSFRAPLPHFLKQKVPRGESFHRVQENIRGRKLNTVCEQAKCPNRTHCYERGTLAFQILGNICTRSCGFCSETFGKPLTGRDPTEPLRIVETARNLRLKHVVITSPARDDLSDDGAQAFVDTVKLFRHDLPAVTVELLTPDFRGRAECLDLVINCKPDIFNHNIETVRRLTPKVRSKATYDRTLWVLKRAHEAQLRTKSGLMVGHGETKEEILQTLQDLVGVGCKMLTLGQYLPPSAHHLPLQKIYAPAEFDALKTEALKFGFIDVAAGPLVRSSYYADKAALQVFRSLRY